MVGEPDQPKWPNQPARESLLNKGDCISVESWRPVPGRESEYEVSNLGRVRSLDRVVESRHQNGFVGERRYRGKVLKLTPDNVGYPKVSLGRGDRRRVHHLVLETFVGPRPEGLVGCHENGDRTDNRVDNLRWDTYAANSRDAIRHGRIKNGNTDKTHCKHGHEFTPENTYRHRMGRACRKCKAELRLK